jgi:hypothetical protein
LPVPLSPLDAYTLLRFAQDFNDRLGQAQVFVAPRRGLTEEKAWLTTAAERFERALSDVAGALERANLLPELEQVREEYAAHFQNIYVDALEKLLAGITFHVSARAPIIEALFPAVKLPTLRRAPRETVERFARELEKRTKGSYVTRMITQPDFAFIHPVLEQVQAAYAQWETAFLVPDVSAEELEVLRERLLQTGDAVELAWHQARLLAEAALVPVEGAFEELALGLRPKRRGPAKATPSVSEPNAEAVSEALLEPDAEAPESEVAAEQEPEARTPRKRAPKPTAQA